MGYMVANFPSGPIVLGDDNAYRRDIGLSHYDKNGRFISQAEVNHKEESASKTFE